MYPEDFPDMFKALEFYSRFHRGMKLERICRETGAKPKEVYDGLVELGVIDYVMERFHNSGIIKYWYMDRTSKGDTKQEMAKQRGVSVKGVENELTKHGIGGKYRQMHDNRRETSRREHVLWVQSGLDDYHIAGFRGVKVDSVKKRFYDFGLMDEYRKRHPRKNGSYFQTKDNGLEAVNRYVGWMDEGLFLDDIAELEGVSSEALWTIFGFHDIRKEYEKREELRQRRLERMNGF